MSDFDKEAEREKLREKFEKEEDNRAATEQMSELLLKGATMTNAHCSECGDPIFRYDGQEFCPTCQKPVARDTQENGADTSDADGQEGQADDGDQIEVADPSDEARVQFGDDSNEPERTAAESGATGGQTAPDAPPAAPQGTSRSDPSANTPPTPPEAGDDRTTQPRRNPAAPSQDARPGAPTPAERTTESEPQSGTGSQDPPVSARQPSSPEGETGDVAANLDAASALLAETVHRFAERAAATENPREAREHLQAAREAAEALDAARF
ncbi:hypothetical protein Har1130_14745 [Haloarcula sp. CBA1130]|uniref:Sjogren's syndrome/scleroderma autoantigen 1 family protein n=1 Tax=unclassified Haloarcula TaxID=2624677 RepID=UPI001243CE79|nr:MULTISPECIES: Sjogren's syndrome/scleroderma autoantigen 1 family protein [unclassified Haloarcula]KAA9399426.1 hypothetical protein Har1129_14845 [Haloarcula sp. CBA1129]KAA9403941.1 hypothetical protein Har1130_14745 [Haloarcula sp. CBA1130]